ncbi:hypothetical protein [Thalassococcus sp. S3]|uniref:hypothetical protein n=1 Tax=Thalassococcus sp. S3 TaxID=2017482 RepID=UPI00102C6BE7|nr:hypothetical protein [Thalassococcus sp. S3]
MPEGQRLSSADRAAVLSGLIDGRSIAEVAFEIGESDDILNEAVADALNSLCNALQPNGIGVSAVNLNELMRLHQSLGDLIGQFDLLSAVVAAR